MRTQKVAIRRVSIISSRTFEEVVRRLIATIGHPDINAFRKALDATTTMDDLEEVVQGRLDHQV